MKIQFNTNSSVQGSDKLKTYFTEVIAEQLQRFSDHITRVEVHLSDVNGDKESPDDKRCLLEARIEGRKPIAVISLANTHAKAITGATEKIMKSFDKIFGRLKDHKQSQ
jgi:ribosome-associated translation inhibitor RaiA